MRGKFVASLVSLCAATILFTTLSLHSRQTIQFPPSTSFNFDHHNNLIQEHLPTSSITPWVDSILLPDWEILLLSSHSPNSLHQSTCLFQNNATSTAKFAGILKSGNRQTFKCMVPHSVRRLRPLLQPILTNSADKSSFRTSPELFRWSFLAYESLSTEDDVVLFVKGVNNRPGVNRAAEEFSCVFFHNGGNYSVKTAVTRSSQEVFRCLHPNEFSLGGGDERIKISLEIKAQIIVPSVTYYTPKPQRRLEDGEEKSEICACTMVHNVGKFLKEWVVYYSKLGVDKFILYDNDSDDGLEKLVQDLNNEDGYNVTTFFWPWPKAQEAGFSHSAIYANHPCTWMMYMDVDEFVFAPSWMNVSYPSNDMLLLASFLPPPTSLDSIGQVLVRCFEFGPSNQLSHPLAGVTQGYTCRRRTEQRHKSFVLLDAVDTSLHNVIHHFRLKEGYRGRTLSLKQGVVNHYKYQAWSEFKTKFRRRVSAYVVDWRQEVNPGSNDRTPGLGFEAIQPEGWATKFCEVNDNRLKVVTQRWFGLDSSKMIWQD